MNWALPVFALLCLLAGAWRRVNVYEAFLEGVSEGLETAKRILPALLTMLCALRAFAACGLMDMLADVCAPLMQRMGIPRETLPLMLLRPLSGSASLAMLRQIFSAVGPDSRAGLVASVMMGSSETVFYTCGLYLGAAGVRSSRHIVPCALLGWLAGSIAAGLIVR